MKKKVGGKLKKRGLLGMSLSPHTRVTSNKEKGQVWIGPMSDIIDKCK